LRIKTTLPGGLCRHEVADSPVFSCQILSERSDETEGRDHSVSNESILNAQFVALLTLHPTPYLSVFLSVWDVVWLSSEFES